MNQTERNIIKLALDNPGVAVSYPPGVKHASNEVQQSIYRLGRLGLIRVHGGNSFTVADEGQARKFLDGDFYDPDHPNRHPGNGRYRTIIGQGGRP